MGEVGEQLHLSPRTISYIERGELPTCTTLGRMVALYNAEGVALSDAQRLAIFDAMIAAAVAK